MQKHVELGHESRRHKLLTLINPIQEALGESCTYLLVIVSNVIVNIYCQIYAQCNNLGRGSVAVPAGIMLILLLELDRSHFWWSWLRSKQSLLSALRLAVILPAASEFQFL